MLNGRFSCETEPVGPTCLELGVASGFLSRDICICSGYLNLKPDGIMRNWKRRWCQLKYDGFLYYYKADNVSHCGENYNSCIRLFCDLTLPHTKNLENCTNKIILYLQAERLCISFLLLKEKVMVRLSEFSCSL